MPIKALQNWLSRKIRLLICWASKSMIFSSVERSDTGPKSMTEPDFEYLDRSARIEAQRVRDVMTEWLNNFPKKDQSELISRIKSGDSINFLSASYELYIHQILLNLGYELEIHPETKSEKGTRPDFLASNSTTGESFYVEAVLATDQSDEEKAADSRKNVVIDSINKLNSPNFYLSLSAKGDPKNTPSGRRLKKRLSNWLKTLDPDQISRDVEENGHEALPARVMNESDWEIEFVAIPKAPEKRGIKKGAIVVSLSSGGRWLTTWESIRDTVMKKGSRYGELDKPMLVAVNVGQFPVDDIDAMQALFGQEQIIVNPNNPSGEHRIERAPNGVWNGPNGVRYRRVSGVLISADVTPWNYGVRDLRIYLNPASNYELEGSLLELTHKKTKNSKMECIDGIHPQELLGLHEGWPE